MDAATRRPESNGSQQVIRNGAGAGGGQTTPPSPLTDSSSAPALSLLSAGSAAAVSTSASAGTPYSDLTSLPSDVSKLSLGPPANSKRPAEPEPPAVSWPYSHAAALDDIPGIAYALDTFLKSHMVESEEYCHRNDPNKCVASLCGLPLSPLPYRVSIFFFRERMYFATGFGLIQCVKALMSYEDEVRLFIANGINYGLLISSYRTFCPRWATQNTEIPLRTNIGRRPPHFRSASQAT